jgi:hypothetical protein
MFEGVFPDIKSLEASPGVYSRYELVADSKWADLSGPLYVPFFETENLLVNNINVDLELVRTEPEFIMHNQVMPDNAKYKIEIRNPTLTVRRYRPSAPFLSSLVRSLEKSKVKYSYRNIDMKAINFSKDLTRIAIPNVTTGQIPSRIIFAFVASDAFKGSYKTNPFHFQHFRLKEINLYVNSNKYPTVPILYSFPTSAVCQGFDYFMEQMGVYQSKTIGISKKDYVHGYTVFAFDLTTDLSASEDHFSMIQNGDIFAEFNFEVALTQETTCVMYTEFEKLIEIDEFRNIRTDEQIV